MRIHDVYAAAQVLIGHLQEAAASRGAEAEVTLWQHVREHRLFLMRTGQDYRFEDYLKSLDPVRTSYVDDAFSLGADTTSRQAMMLLLRTLGLKEHQAQRELLIILIEMLNYIVVSRQQAEFSDYLSTYYSDGPWTVAFFSSYSEAERWLHQLAEPPSWMYVLIGDELYEARYSREEDERRLHRAYEVESLLEEAVAEGPPPARRSFRTREEAQEWLKAHPAAPMSFISIAGENCLALYHKKINRHSLHPVVSTLKAWEEEK